MRKLSFVLMLGFFFLIGPSGLSLSGAEEVQKITKEELKSFLGNPDVVVVDVRTPKDWNKSKSKIKGAVRENPEQAEQWIKKYSKNQHLIFYCA